MTFELLSWVLACREPTFLEANPHKVLAAAVGFSCLTAAFFVRQQRHYTGGKGHAFEVVMDPPSAAPAQGAGEPPTSQR